MLPIRNIASVLIAGVLLTGCAAGIPNHRVHHSLLEAPAAQLPTRVLLLPIDVEVSEVSAGGVSEEVKSWSDQATHNVEQALRQHADADARVELVELPTLSPTETETVEQHLALYDVVGGTAFAITNTPVAAWDHKRKHFDYSLGSGLEFLRARSGAETALIVIGMDQISTTERKALAVGAAVFGVGIPLGVSFVSVGVVDLASGDLLWLNYAHSYGDADLRRAEDAAEMVEQMFQSYPGIEEYRQFTLK